MADKKERRKYPPDFKQDAVQLTNKIGVAQAADKLDIPLSTLKRWRYLKSVIPVEQSQNIFRLQLEIKRLKKELTEQKAIISMLRKVPDFFSKETEK